MANFLSSVVFFVIVAASMGCTPPLNYKAPEIATKIKYSDIVAYGIPRKAQHDPNFPVEMETVFVVDFEVRCIFKGAPLKENIRIFEAGSVPGLCLSTNMTVDKELIVYLRNDEGKLKPAYREDPGGKQYHDEMIVHCEITAINYPEGKGPNNNKEECVDPYLNDYEDCIEIPADTTVGPLPEELVPTEPMEKKPEGPASPPLPSAEKTGQDQPNPETGNHAEMPPPKDGYKTEVKENVDSSVEEPNGGANTIFLQLSTLLFMLFSTFVLL